MPRFASAFASNPPAFAASTRAADSDSAMTTIVTCAVRRVSTVYERAALETVAAGAALRGARGLRAAGAATAGVPAVSVVSVISDLLTGAGPLVCRPLGVVYHGGADRLGCPLRADRLARGADRPPAPARAAAAVLRPLAGRWRGLAGSGRNTSPYR